MNDPVKTPLLRRPPKRRSRIVEALRREIIDGRLRPGDRMPPRRDLRDRFGVSIVTVDSAMALLMREGFVITRGTSGTFVSEHPAHLTRFALVFPHDPAKHESRFYDALIASAGSAGEKREGHKVECYFRVDGAPDSQDFRRLRSDVEHHRLAGLIFSGPPMGLWDTPIVRQPGVPRVCLAWAGDTKIAGVRLNHRKFFELAMTHFRSKARRRVAMLAPSIVPETHADLFTEHAKSIGLAAPTHLMQFVDFTSYLAIRHALDLLLRLPAGERPDGLLLPDDNLVEYATRSLAEFEPARTAGLEVVAMTNKPLLPTLHVPVVGLGFDIGHLLGLSIELLDQQRASRQRPSSISVDPEFILGAPADAARSRATPAN